MTHFVPIGSIREACNPAHNNSRLCGCKFNRSSTYIAFAGQPKSTKRKFVPLLISSIKWQMHHVTNRGAKFIVPIPEAVGD